jgi:hypothetical protein
VLVSRRQTNKLGSFDVNPVMRVCADGADGGTLRPLSVHLQWASAEQHDRGQGTRVADSARSMGIILSAIKTVSLSAGRGTAHSLKVWPDHALSYWL